MAILAGAVWLRSADPYLVETFRVKTFDLYNRLQPREPQPGSPVRIIDIDEKSLGEIGQWPWPRTVVADLVTALRDYGVAVVGFDVVFAEPDRTSPDRIAGSIRGADPQTLERLRALPSNEQAMIEALGSMRVVLGQAGARHLDPNNPPPVPPRESQRTSVLGARGGDPTEHIVRLPVLIHNLPQLEAAASGLGFFSVDEEVDGVVRRVPMIKQIAEVIKPALTVEMLRVGLQGNSIFSFIREEFDYSGQNQIGVNSIRLQTRAVPGGGFTIPTDGAAKIWVYYAKPDQFNTPQNTGRMYISAADVIARRVPPEKLQGTLVLVGTSAVGLLDIRATPIEPRLPGVEVHANILENVLSQTFLTHPFWMVGAEVGIMIAVGLGLIFFIPRVGPVFTLVGLTVAAGSLVGVAWWAFSEHRILVDVTYPGAISLALFALLTYGNYARDAAEKRQVRTAFAQYLSPDLVEQLAENPDQLTLGGETKRMTMLFCDVRGFTAISEFYKTNPQGLTLLMNRLLTPLSNEILTRGGTIDKYMGDCIMAFWNAPLPRPNQESDSVESALAMFVALEELNVERRREAEEQGIPYLALAIGIGLNSGEVVVGNMGSAQRFDYSVLGDAVNLASRLEGQSKSYGVGLVIGEETHKGLTPGRFATFELDLIAVKGKKEAVRIFTAIGEIAALGAAAVTAQQALHAQLISAYRAQDWDAAEAALGEAKGGLEGSMDGFYEIYAERIAEYRANPPGEAWDGVYIATSK
jgi:adenylate cyclase